MNVGASAPEQAGQYFSWGNTDGHTPGDGYEFTTARYNNTPGVEISGNIPLSHDAARANMDGSWRMPTKTEFQELVDNCTFLWTKQNGVAGALFTSSINGNSIFIPAAGYVNGAVLQNFGERGRSWSSTLVDEEFASCLYFDVSGANPGRSEGRFLGLPIRAVED